MRKYMNGTLFPEYGTSRIHPHPHMEQIGEIAAETLLREPEED